MRKAKFHLIKGFADIGVYNKEKKVSLFVISIEQSRLDSATRIKLVEGIRLKMDQFGRENGVEMHYTGN